jgi:2-methylcitrate dehydratase PrpD
VGKNYLQLAKALSGGKEATVPGCATKISCLNAAYVNGQLANILDFDDTYDFFMPAHPGNGLVQTAVALGEMTGATGEELLTSVIVGYEVCLRVGRAGGQGDWQWPIHSSEMTIGTAAISSRLLHLDENKVCEALRQVDPGTAPAKREKFDIPAGLDVSDIKNNAGMHAVKGILAARRAQSGLVGWRFGLLDSSFTDWYLAGGNPDGYGVLTSGLGKVYRLMEVSFKPTPSCRWTHAPITALWQALDKKPVTAEEVKQIVVKGVKRLDRPEWEHMLQAQFSMYCALAMAAREVEPGPNWYVTDRFKDPDIRELAKKIKLENDPEAEEFDIRGSKTKCSVKVIFQDGTVKEALIFDAIGAPANPMSDEELRRKFRANTRSIFKASRVDKIIDMIMKLEKLNAVSSLTKMLNFKL